MLKLNYHYAGFFACSSVRLLRIIDYINKNKKIPEEIKLIVHHHMYSTKNTVIYMITLYCFSKIVGI
jgi:uncharacterized membrane protein (GlpM family)